MLSHQPLSELFLVGPMQSQQFGQRLRQHIWGHQGLRAKKHKTHTACYIYIYLFVVAVIIYMHCSFGLHHFDGTQVDRRKRKRVRILYSHKSPFETRSHSLFMTPTKSSSLYVCTNL